MKKLLSILLTALMLLSVVSVSLVSFAESGTVYKAGEVIKFGNYPQSEVKDEALLEKLNALDFKWKSYGYYEGTDLPDGKMGPSDKMKYADVVLEGAKYRAVKLTAYRPAYSFDKWDTSSGSVQEEYGFLPHEIYWFKFEPINWIILDPEKGLVLSESILDAQPYQNFIIGTLNEENGGYEAPYYGDSDKTTHISNYASSSIRKWLTEDFYNAAFTDTQKDKLETTKLENKSYEHILYDFEIEDKIVSTYDAPETNDKVFLLSLADSFNYLYDMENDEFAEINLAKGSNYALSQACMTDTDTESKTFGCGYWCFRTAFDSTDVLYSSFNSSGPKWDSVVAPINYLGVRPACVLKKIDTDYCMHFNTDIKNDKVVEATCTKTGSYEEVTFCKDCDAELSRVKKTSAKIAHDYVEKVTKATTSKDGKKVPTCSMCGATKSATVIPKASNVSVQYSEYAYSGQAKNPKIIVQNSKGKNIAASNYTIKFSKTPKAIGSYSVKVTFKGDYSGSKTLKFKIIPDQVKNLKKTKVTATTMNLSWSKVPGAKYYAIQYSTDGSTWKTFTNAATSTSIKVTNLKAGTKYQFRVKALDSTKKFSGAFSSKLVKWTLCSAPTVTLKSTKAKTAVATWKKLTGAKKYIVQKSTDGNNWKTVKTVTGTKYTFTGLASGKKIYVRVQAVNAENLKSSHSKVQSVKVK